MTAVTHILLQKAASDNGFDIALDRSGNWLCFASSHAPLKLWMTVDSQSQFIAAFSDSGLMVGLNTQPIAIQSDFPIGSNLAFSVTNIKDLYPLLRRAFQLSRSLPNEPLNEFKKSTSGLPRSTEAERLIIQRIGQDIFRRSLLDYWDGKCVITGLQIPELLRASHIKPWKDCDSDEERLDVFNGLLLAPHLDAAFDRGFISFEDDGSIIVSSYFNDLTLMALGLNKTLKINGLTDVHWNYLKWHRENLFTATYK